MILVLAGGGGADAAAAGDVTLLDPLATLMAGAVGFVYMLVQGRVDRATELVKGLGGKVVDENTLEEILRRLREQDTWPPPPDSE